MTAPTGLVEFEGDWFTAQEICAEQGWTDGLPVVPPTEELVAEMLASVGSDGAESLGVMPPSFAAVELQKLAANAVMAGCEPRYFPVVVAGVRALLTPPFNLLSMQTSTHPSAPLLIVHGPIARELGIAAGTGALGPGHRPNATIGRAIRLTLMNIGGGRPGLGDFSAQGSPAMYSYCVAENVDASPWPEMHVTLGFDEGDSVVTVFDGEAPHNVNDHESTVPERILDIAADVMSTLGTNSWYKPDDNGRVFHTVLFCPEHAEIIGNHGWSRQDVQYYLYNRARRRMSDVSKGGMWGNRDWPAWLRAMEPDPDAMVPAVWYPQDILVGVVGGPGRHSCVIPGGGGACGVVSQPVTKTLSGG